MSLLIFCGINYFREVNYCIKARECL